MPPGLKIAADEHTEKQAEVTLRSR
jgi:hypothetical protein